MELPFVPHVLDTSAGINLERSHRLDKLPPPGDWIIVPSIIATELNPADSRTPEPTKKWLNKGKIAHFQPQEETLYKQLILNPAVDDGEAQAIAIAYHRGTALIIDEKRNGVVWNIARNLGIECVSSEEFWNVYNPHLPGF